MVNIEERVFFTVTQVNLYIKSLLDNDKHMSDLIVKGEISNFKQHTSGHMYMSLKDDGGVIRAVMFKGAASKLKFAPQSGMKVIAHGRVTVYERDGSYQLYIDDMQPDGIGALHMAFEQLKEKLSQMGMFDERNKKPLPRFPGKIGIVTAPTGAAIRDILNILSRRFPYADVVLYPVLVQGESAAGQIAEAIEYFNTEKSADVLIVGRGGGSIEDLWAFNEEVVAHAIFNSQIPVVSAVGHEVDFTIADFVSDVRAPTPSAAAELGVPSQMELVERINTVYGRILFCASKLIERKRLQLSQYIEKTVMKNPAVKIEEKRLYLDNVQKHFENATFNILNAKKQMLTLYSSKLNALSPLSVLGRGYSVAKDNSGAVIKSITQVKAGDKINLVVNDGSLDCEVQSVGN